jgi:hypothetical protein
MPSLSWRPMVYTGFSDVMGSWKIIAMSLPRTCCMSRSLILRSDLPRYSTSPPMIFPGGMSTRPMMVREVTDLPEPDSPTTPRVSPLSRLYDTPLTALTTPSCV